MIQLESITFSHQPGTLIFQDFTWQAGRGQSWAVLGPSGCGKTTLLYLLAGLRFPSKGNVLVDGQVVARPRPRTGLILQEYGLLPWATVRQNAALGLRLRQFYGPDGRHAPPHPVQTSSVAVWLERLGLAEHADKFPGQLSGGQRQRTAIARTLALKPDLLLMDEPFASLDAPTRESLQNLILELKDEQGLTLITVTHAIEEAAVLGEKILLLSQPPNCATVVVENPSAGSPNYRSSRDYAAMCQRLRSQLQNEAVKL